MNGLPPTDSQEFLLGKRLRLEAAVAAGVATADATAALLELRPLERVEYLKKSNGLKVDERRRLWTLRAGLRGLDTGQVRLELDAGQVGDTLKDYWRWVIESAYPGVEPGANRPSNRIPGNLASAIARDPGKREFVLGSWATFAGLIGVEHESVLEQFGRDLDSCRPSDVQAPTPRALDLGKGIAELTGLPQQLISAHGDAWLREHAILMATNQAVHDRARRSSMDEFSRGGRSEVSLGYAPRTMRLPDGRVRLVLADPELELLNEDIAGGVLARLVRTLRRGELPGNNLAFAVANAAFITRRHADQRPPAHQPPEPGGFGCPDGQNGSGPADQAEDQEVVLEAAEQFIIAQDWLSNAIEETMRRFAGRLRTSGPDGIFPTAAYGKARSASLGSAHLRAAQNCLQYSASSAYLRRATLRPQLLAEADPRAEFARHMRSTAPALWNNSPAARQATRGLVGAVASVAWLAAEQISAEDAPLVAVEAARELLFELGNFAGLAALHGMVGMLQRYVPGKQIASPAGHAIVQAGCGWIEELASALACRPRLADHPALPAVIGSIRELAEQYQAAATTVAAAGRAAARLLAVAVGLTRRRSA